jgi:hypothetical protein
MEKINLSKTHTRILGTLLFVLEQKIEHIEHIINQPEDNASYTVLKNLNANETHQLLSNCGKLKMEIGIVAKKFGIKKRKIDQYQFINTLQSQMWEHISDAFSDKLKGYGEKLKEDAKQVDPFIQELSDTINLLKI